MGIKFNTPPIPSKQIEWTLEGVNIYRAKSDWMAVVNYVLNDTDNKPVEYFKKVYTGEEFNLFWKDFNSLAFLYKKLSDEKGIPFDDKAPGVENEIENKSIVAVPVEVVNG
jgi:hypothetical protein